MVMEEAPAATPLTPVMGDLFPKNSLTHLPTFSHSLRRIND